MFPTSAMVLLRTREARMILLYNLPVVIQIITNLNSSYSLHAYDEINVCITNTNVVVSLRIKYDVLQTMGIVLKINTLEISGIFKNKPRVFILHM